MRRVEPIQRKGKEVIGKNELDLNKCLPGPMGLEIKIVTTKYRK